MALEIDIVKRLTAFALEIAFVAQDEPLAVLGASGAGKTMLLRCIAGLERPDRGRIVLNGRVLFDRGRGIDVPARHRRVGLLFQQYALFPHRTVAQNIAFGLERLPKAERIERVASLVNRTHIAGLEERYPRQISGGEQQRTALARALAIDPEALLLDEPLSALDTHLRSQIERQLQETFSSYQRPSLLVTHNIEEAYRLGKTLLVLSRGRVAAAGTKDAIFRYPPTREVAQLTGCKNISRARKVSEGVVEAVDWGIRVRVRQSLPEGLSHIGIRAHHIDLVESGAPLGDDENVFPCWLTMSSETPFRSTLFLSVHHPPAVSSGYQLQVEVFKEKRRLGDDAQPWHIRLPPDNLFLMRE